MLEKAKNFASVLLLMFAFFSVYSLIVRPALFEEAERKVETVFDTYRNAVMTFVSENLSKEHGTSQ
ncbi:MAG: hypothetical protein JAY72_20525 [Candidatus Thiodiazotropha endolucinida]|nr:hypothetical protein [Candidatus Thiodiazotropha taylori]MCW4324068.1 hypothetical protein [Candidatus Thiodiazotropha taylori]